MMKKLSCWVALILVVALVIGTAGFAGIFPTGALAEQEKVYHNILSIVKRVGDKDLLITYDDYGYTRYGIFHQDDSILPLYLDQNGMENSYFPNYNYHPDYEFGVFPNGDYYEQMNTNDLQEGVVWIRSSEGAILYSSESPEAAEHIVGFVGDKIAMIRRVTGFLDSTWKLCLVDHHGRKLSEDHDIGEWGIGVFLGGLTDLGFGYLGIGGAGNEAWTPSSRRAVFYDTNRDICFITDPWRIRPFDPDTKVSLWARATGLFNMDTAYYAISVDMLTDAESMEARVSQLTYRIGGIRERTIAEGFYYADDVFYHYSGEVAFSLPDYGPKVERLYFGNFENGYMPVIYKGADGNAYLTMLNTHGNVQYDPIRLKDYGYSESHVAESSWYNSSATGLNYKLFINNGYAFYESDSGVNLITPNGKELSFQVPSKDRYYRGMTNGYLIFSKVLLRLTDTSRYITQGYTIETVYDYEDNWDEGEYSGGEEWNEDWAENFSEIWTRTWINVDEPQTQIVISSLGDGVLHAQFFFYRMISFEAELTGAGYDSLWFEDKEGVYRGDLVLDVNNSLLYVYIYADEDDFLYDYFSGSEFLFTTEEFPDLIDYGYEPEDYPDASEWTGHWVATSGEHQADLYISQWGDGFDFDVQFCLDNTWYYAAVGESWDPWGMDFYTEELSGQLYLGSEDHTLSFYEVSSTDYRVNNVLLDFQFEMEFTWADASCTPDEIYIPYRKSPTDRSVEYPVDFNSEVFMQATDKFHENIAQISIMLAANAYDLEGCTRGEQIVQAYRRLGIPDGRIKLFNYLGNRLNTAGFEEENHMEFSIASRSMGEYALMLITLRGSGELFVSRDWEVDLNAESDDFMNTWIHQGFHQYASRVLDGINVYMDEHPEIQQAMEADKLKVLICGHSFGAAGTNILGAYLTSKSNLQPWVGMNDNYVYGFATPRVVHEKDGLQPTTGSCSNIFNVVFPQDPVAQLPEDFRFAWKRFGTTLTYATTYKDDPIFDAVEHFVHHEPLNYINAVFFFEAEKTQADRMHGVIVSNDP